MASGTIQLCIAKGAVCVEAKREKMAKAMNYQLTPLIKSTRIADVRQWCQTSHDGRQFDMFRTAPEDAPSCMTGWMECE